MNSNRRRMRRVSAVWSLLWLHHQVVARPAGSGASAFASFGESGRPSEPSRHCGHRGPWCNSATRAFQRPPSTCLHFTTAAAHPRHLSWNNLEKTRLFVTSKKDSPPRGGTDSSSSSDDSSWLTSAFEGDDKENVAGPTFLEQSQELEEEEDEESGSVHIPSGGVSVSDAMEAALLDRFVSSVVPIETLPAGTAAQIVTASTTSGSLESVRYLVALSLPPQEQPQEQQQQQQLDYCLVDVPPYSRQLVDEMNSFMSKTQGRLRLVVVTSRDAIHYDSASSTDYVTMVRKSDLHKWKEAFPDLTIVSYRLDTPRDCREVVTQVLDGYGPFALDGDDQDGMAKLNFVETGRPLTVDEWDFNVAQDVMSGQAQPPDDRATEAPAVSQQDDESMYSPERIREREAGKRLLALYTPGHTYGSLSYVFPDIGVCCSGYAIPVEDTRLSRSYGDDDEDDVGMADNYGKGPLLDCRGYITTNRAGIRRQMESARNLIDQYGDRFEVLLPSRGDPVLWLPTSIQERKDALLDIVQQYEKIGTIYEELGITSSS